MSTIKRTYINVISSIFVLITNIVISFWLSPFIVKNLGVEANGFVTLANSFVIYAQLIVTALNSMAARFITISYSKKDFNGANVYYNSVFWGKAVIVALLLTPAVLLILNLQKAVDVPVSIVRDVKLLFAFVFFNFFITTAAPNWECGTYVTNRLDRSYIPQMAATLLRFLILIFMFMLLAPRVWYVGFATTIAALTTLLANQYNTRVLTPELRIEVRKGKRIYSFRVIRELVSAGIWNTISSVGNMLLSGLDLIICNVFLGATQMGVLSLSKILPNYMQQFSSSIIQAFAPELTINFAKGDRKAVLSDMNRAMKLTSIIMTIPLAGLIIFGKEFFELWVPSQNAALLQTLSVLAILGYMLTSGTQVLYNVFTTVNKVKENAVAMVISGVLSVSLTFILILFTDLGLYAVAGVSTFCNSIRNMCFTVPATAKYLGLKWYQFFPEVGMSMFSSALLVLVGYIMKPYLPGGSWMNFFLAAAIFGAIGLIINLWIILKKTERAYLFQIIKSRVTRHL
jgi:O-antigen/teichoic acid export membrane protein